MAALGDDSRIPQFLPPLAHIAVVNIVTHSFGNLVKDLVTLDRAFTDIKYGISARFNGESHSDHKVKTAKEKLLFIPAHLRDQVYQAIIGMSYENCTWLLENIGDQQIPTNIILTLKKQIKIFFRSDGTVHRIKTARSFVLNENVNIRVRFHIACLYCFEKKVLSLWREMEACGETNNFDAGNNLMTHFWVKWIQEGSRTPWLQALKEYFIFPRELSVGDHVLIRPFFTLLEPEERDTFLTYLERSFNTDDFRFCLYAATKEEEAKILENDIARLLIHHLNWPLQHIFLEIAEMVWPSLDVFSFYTVLMFIWDFKEGRKEFDYRKLFEDFWNRCPINLKETVKGNPDMIKEINSILNEIKRINEKKWIRRNGRLESASHPSYLA